MRVLVGVILFIITILITLIVAFLAMTSIDDMGEDDEL